MRPRRESGSGVRVGERIISSVSPHRNLTNKPMLRDADEEEDVSDGGGSEVLADESTRVEDSMSPEARDVICFQCEHESCESEDVATCSGFACFSIHVTEGSTSQSAGREYFKKGCSDVASYGFHCRSPSFKGRNPNAGKYVTDCCRQNFCNNETAHSFLHRVQYNQSNSLGASGDASSISPVLLILLPVAGLLLASILILVYWSYRRKQNEKPATSVNNRRDAEQAVDGDELTHFMDGEPRRRIAGLQLIRRTFAGEIGKEDNPVGSGCFGTVYKAWYRGDAIAVKVFANENQSYFDRECDLHSMQMFRHTNILGFIGSDVIATPEPGVSEYWLVTEFHDQGSLSHHLKHHSVCMRDAHSILRSAAAGLVHLHLPLHTGTTSKPGIAHRNLKPTNLLMKRCRDRDNSEVWEVVIADFGLAVKQTDFETGTELPEDLADYLIVGSTRYMSPEMLDRSILGHTDLFSVMAKSDVYAFALIMWETLRRVEIVTESGDKLALDYQMAYEELLPMHDPTHDQVRSVVVTAGMRPQFPTEWMRDRRLTCMRDMISESWKENPESRLTMKMIHNKLLSIWKDGERQPQQQNCSSSV